MSALLLAALAFAPQAQDPEVFTVTEATVDGGAVRYAVSADKRQIHCMDALRELAGAMNWNLDVESTPLENDLRFASVDLNLAGQDPRMVAQLIAVAGGADTVFDEPAAFEGARVTLHVVQQPSAETESGRQRLRAVAGQWYRSFLRDELAYEPLVEKEGNAVRMHLGERSGFLLLPPRYVPVLAQVEEILEEEAAAGGELRRRFVLAVAQTPHLMYN